MLGRLQGEAGTVVSTLSILVPSRDTGPEKPFAILAAAIGAHRQTGFEQRSLEPRTWVFLHPIPVLCKPKEISLKSLSSFQIWMVPEFVGVELAQSQGGCFALLPQETILPAKSGRDVSYSLGSQKEKL